MVVVVAFMAAGVTAVAVAVAAAAIPLTAVFDIVAFDACFCGIFVAVAAFVTATAFDCDEFVVAVAATFELVDRCCFCFKKPAAVAKSLPPPFRRK